MLLSLKATDLASNPSCLTQYINERRFQDRSSNLFKSDNIYPSGLRSGLVTWYYYERTELRTCWFNLGRRLSFQLQVMRWHVQLSYRGCTHAHTLVAPYTRHTPMHLSRPHDCKTHLMEMEHFWTCPSSQSSWSYPKKKFRLASKHRSSLDNANRDPSFRIRESGQLHPRSVSLSDDLMGPIPTIRCYFNHNHALSRWLITGMCTFFSATILVVVISCWYLLFRIQERESKRMEAKVKKTFW